jgi:hypothetical protein
MNSASVACIREEHSLRVFESSLSRRIFGLKREELHREKVKTEH